MATTWMKAVHKGTSIAATLKIRTDYALNYDKTEDGELIDSFGCAPQTADTEFLLSKRLYEQKTGRNQGKHDVIAYHVRMSFKPGEVTAEKALELGRELALRWTKNKHQFIVAAHTNTNNPHAHIVFNSVNLDCDGKYQDFKRSAIALRRVSDQICLEHGLSVIDKPGLSKGYNRTEYLGDKKPPTVREQLRDLMDTALNNCKDYNGFIAALKALGVEVKQRKQLSFKPPGAKKFSRQDTLGEDYSFDAILERITGKRVVAPKKKVAVPTDPQKINLLIDVEAKIQEGKGAGYEQWARIFNIKQAAKTLMFLQENNLTDYDVLTKTANDSSARYNELSTQIKADEARMKEIKELQKYITNYKRTLEIYRGYRDSKWSEKYLAAFESDIIIHKAAKKYFDGLGIAKLPSMDALKQEYAKLSANKGKQYAELKQARQKMIELRTAKHNVDTLLDEPRQPSKTHGRGAR